MKIDFKAEILNIDGISPVYGPDKLPILYKTAVINALLAPPTNSQPLSGVESVKRFTLAQKIQGDTTEYTSEEAVLVKDVVAQNWAPLIVGRVHELIEGGAI